MVPDDMAELQPQAPAVGDGELADGALPAVEAVQAAGGEAAADGATPDGAATPADADAAAAAEAAAVTSEVSALARLYGEPLLKLPTDLYIPPDALEIFLDAFEGPLDLLLYLIRKQNFNILDIPMAQVTLCLLYTSPSPRDS